MTTRFFLFACAALLCIPGAMAQRLTAGTPGQEPGPAPQSSSLAVLYSQTGTFDDGIFASDAVDLGLSAEAADDFTVPAGPGWLVTSVDAGGYDGAFPQTAFSDVVVRFYADAGTVPATTPLFTYSGAATTESVNAQNDVTVSFASTPLAPGNYWVSVQPVTNPGGLFYWQNVLTAQVGDLPAWRESGGFGTGCTAPTWGAVNTCIASTAFNNLNFSINGTVIPVELTSFTGTADGTSAQLRWETASETNNAGFEVQALRGGEWAALGFVDGHGTTTEAQSYSFRANGLAAGTHAFRLRQVDFDGAFEYHGDVEVTVGVPGTHALSQAYPNPFNPQSQFDLSVASTQNVRVELFNALGQRVAVLFEGTMEADATQQFRVDGSSLASGLYVVRVTGESFTDALTLSLLK